MDEIDELENAEPTSVQLPDSDKLDNTTLSTKPEDFAAGIEKFKEDRERQTYNYQTACCDILGITYYRLRPLKLVFLRGWSATAAARESRQGESGVRDLVKRLKLIDGWIDAFRELFTPYDTTEIEWDMFAALHENIKKGKLGHMKFYCELMGITRSPEIVFNRFEDNRKVTIDSLNSVFTTTPGKNELPGGTKD